MKLKTLALPILSTLFAVNSLACKEKELQSHYDTDKISFVEKSIEKISKSCGGEKNVLVFLDLDNTLLAMKKPLGSDQWFTWQSKLLKNDDKNPESKFKVSKDFYTLLKITEELFLNGGMRPVEDQTVAFVKKLQKEKRVSIHPVNFARGMSWNGKAILMDEAQNSSFREIVTVLTRIGKYSRCIIMADPMQTDLKNGNRGGFVNFMIFSTIKRAGIWVFTLSSLTKKISFGQN